VLLQKTILQSLCYLDQGKGKNMSGINNPLLSTLQANQILNLVRQHLKLVLTSTARVQPGQALTASLVPSSPVLDVSELANGIVNLALASKDVLFSSANPVDVPPLSTLSDSSGLDGDTLIGAAGGIFGKQPFPPPIAGGLIVPQTSGLMAQLFGTITPPSLKISVEIKWVVRDQNGNILTEQNNLIAPEGLTSPNVILHIVPPLFREYRLDTLRNPGGSVVCLSAEITLRLEDKTLSFTAGPIPVLLLPLLIPTVVVLFSEPNFDVTHDSAVVLVVPEHSPFSSAEPLFKVLRQIEKITSTLRSIGGLASFFLGIDDILETVPKQPRFRLAAARKDDISNPSKGQGVPKLGDIKLKQKPWYDLLGSDPNFDDKVTSLIVFGAPGTMVSFFDDTNYRTAAEHNGQGNFDIRLKDTLPDIDFYVAIRTLDTSDAVAPETFPPGRVTGFEANTHSPTDHRWLTDMSSVLFPRAWTGKIDEERKNPPPLPPLTCGGRGPVRTKGNADEKGKKAEGSKPSAKHKKDDRKKKKK
jgi:hypothetical protein